MLNIIFSLQENANQNHEIPLNTHWNDWKIISVAENMEKLEPSWAAGGNVKWYSWGTKQLGSSSKSETQLLCHPTISFLHTYPRELKPIFTQQTT